MSATATTLPVEIAVAAPIHYMAEKWVPDHDDGATFTPGHWAEVTRGVIGVGDVGPAFRLAGEGFSLKFWTDPADAPTA